MVGNEEGIEKFCQRCKKFNIFCHLYLTATESCEY